MKCTNCGASLSDSAKFCPECGTKVVRELFCAECGTKLAAGTKFCPECGTKVGSTAAAPTPKTSKESYPKDNGSSKWLTIEDGVLTECDCEEAEGVVIIPEGVTEIGEWAFSYCDSVESIVFPESVDFIDPSAFDGDGGEDSKCTALRTITVASGNRKYKSVDGVLYSDGGKTLICYPAGKDDEEFTVPDGVETIGEYAFTYCDALTSIKIPASVTKIGDYAFDGCEALESIRIPEGVETIGEDAFGGCESLRAITVASGNKEFKSVDGVLYADGGKKLFRYPQGKEGDSFTVPNEVNTIGDSAFWVCEALESVKLPDSLKEIGDSAFYDCEALESIRIPDGVETIGESAFSYCEALESVKLPDSLKEIGDSAFNECKALESIKIPDGVETIGDSAFNECNALESVKLPEGLKEIGDSAFSGCEALESITLPASVTKIGEYAFSCESLKQVRYEGTTDEWEEVEQCEGWLCETQVKKVRCSDGYGELSDDAFGEDDEDEDDEEEDDDEEQNTAAFDDDDEEEEDTAASDDDDDDWDDDDWDEEEDTAAFDDNDNGSSKWLTIEDGVLTKCDREAEGVVIIPEGVTEIGKSAFRWCSALTSVVIPASVTEIGKYAFNICEALESITLPASVSKIGEFAFSFCDSLKQVRYEGTTDEWEEVEQGYNWLTETQVKKVRCSDGFGELSDDALD